MRIHRSLLAVLSLALVTAACSGAAPGASTGSQGGSTVSAASAKAAMKTSFSQFGAITTYSNKNVIVFYAAVGGTDDSGAVDAAVKGL